MSETSIVEYFSAHEKYKCGYCKSEDSCYSFGLWGHALTPLDYQNLIDRGWRRSGKYCYKPTMRLTCCPQYTIRCEALKFTLSRSHKKVLKKVRRFLAFGERERSASQPSESSEQGMDISDIPECMDVQILNDIKKVSKITRSDIEASNVGNADSNTNIPQNQDKDVLPHPSSTKSTFSVSSHANVSSNPASPTKSYSDKPCKKAKELRRERKLQKLLTKGISEDEALSSIQKKPIEPKTVENFLDDPFSEEPLYKLELKLIPSSFGNPLFTQTFEESYCLYTKYQMAIHKDPPDKCTDLQFIRFLVKNPFQLRLVPSNLDSDEFASTYDESYKLYKKYQMKIHNDTEDACAQDSYQDFLIESPFERLDGVSSSESSAYGSFHQQYWLNGKLIAVGVIDILSYCVSSVYFYYDPDYSFLSLGTYAALREIALTRELNQKYPEIRYYYMGYYIHSCVKMRYKGQYHPSYLLCPETYIFQPIEKCKPKLDQAKYQRLEEEPNKEDSDGVVSLQEVQILCNHKRMSYQSYKKLKKHVRDEDEVREYAGFVGRKCYTQMLLFRS